MPCRACLCWAALQAVTAALWFTSALNFGAEAHQHVAVDCPPSSSSPWLTSVIIEPNTDAVLDGCYVAVQPNQMGFVLPIRIRASQEVGLAGHVANVSIVVRDGNVLPEVTVVDGIMMANVSVVVMVVRAVIQDPNAPSFSILGPLKDIATHHRVTLTLEHCTIEVSGPDFPTTALIFTLDRAAYINDIAVNVRHTWIQTRNYECLVYVSTGGSNNISVAIEDSALDMLRVAVNQLSVFRFNASHADNLRVVLRHTLISLVRVLPDRVTSFSGNSSYAHVIFGACAVLESSTFIVVNITFNASVSTRPAYPSSHQLSFSRVFATSRSSNVSWHVRDLHAAMLNATADTFSFEIEAGRQEFTTCTLHRCSMVVRAGGPSSLPTDLAMMVRLRAPEAVHTLVACEEATLSVTFSNQGVFALSSSIISLLAINITNVSVAVVHSVVDAALDHVVLLAFGDATFFWVGASIVSFGFEPGYGLTSVGRTSDVAISVMSSSVDLASGTIQSGETTPLLRSGCIFVSSGILVISVPLHNVTVAIHHCDMRGVVGNVSGVVTRPAERTWDGEGAIILHASAIVAAISFATIETLIPPVVRWLLQSMLPEFFIVTSLRHSNVTIWNASTSTFVESLPSTTTSPRRSGAETIAFLHLPNDVENTTCTITSCRGPLLQPPRSVGSAALLSGATCIISVIQETSLGQDTAILVENVAEGAAMMLMFTTLGNLTLSENAKVVFARATVAPADTMAAGRIGSSALAAFETGIPRKSFIRLAPSPGFLIGREEGMIEVDGCRFVSMHSLLPSHLLTVLMPQTSKGLSATLIRLGCNVWNNTLLGSSASLYASRVSPERLVGDRSLLPFVAFLPEGDGVYNQTLTCRGRAFPSPTMTPREVVLVSSDPPSQRVESAAGSLIVVVLSVNQFAGGAGGLSSSVHALQTSLLVRRMLQRCRSDEETSTDHNSSVITSAVVPEDENDEELCCDISTSPTQLYVGPHGNFIGALLGNTLLTAAVGLAQAVGRAALHHLAMSSFGFHLSARVRIVLGSVESVCFSNRGLGTIWSTFTLLQPPTVAVSVALVASMGSSAPSVVVGVIGALVWVVPCWVLAYRGTLMDGVPRPQGIPNHIPRKRRTSLASTLKRAMDVLVQPTENLVLPRKHDGTIDEAYGPVIASYRACRLWYFNVELIFGVAAGLVMGLLFAAADPCTVHTYGWLIVALSGLEMTTAVVLRPFSTPIDFLVLVLVSSVSITSEVVAITADTAAGDEAASALGLVASVVQLAAMVILGINLAQSRKAFRSLRARHVGQHRTARRAPIQTLRQKQQQCEGTRQIGRSSVSRPNASRTVGDSTPLHVKQSEALRLLISCACEKATAEGEGEHGAERVVH